MGPHRRLRIYVRYDFPSIIKYLELSKGDLFTVYKRDWCGYHTTNTCGYPLFAKN